MDIFLSILKAIIGYFILMFAGTNLIGMIVRGIQPTYSKDVDGNLISTVNISSGNSIILTVLSAIASIVYLYALYHYWSAGVMLAGLILMLTRIPDLLFEMKTGEKINLQNKPKQPIDIVCTIFSWLALPLLWYSLYYFN